MRFEMRLYLIGDVKVNVFSESITFAEASCCVFDKIESAQLTEGQK